MYPFALNSSPFEVDHAVWKGGWTKPELAKLIGQCEALEKKPGDGLDGADISDIRDSTVAWVPVNNDTAWIYERIGQQIRRLNNQYFNFDLWGFEDALQYTVYEAKPDSPRGGQHYGWHTDMFGKNLRACRKLSFTIQLSDPMDYQGGELWLCGTTRHVLSKERALMCVFPSFLDHEVTPVTAGVRRSLVGWVVGPQFR